MQNSFHIEYAIPELFINTYIHDFYCSNRAIIKGQ